MTTTTKRPAFPPAIIRSTRAPAAPVSIFLPKVRPRHGQRRHGTSKIPEPRLLFRTQLPTQTQLKKTAPHMMSYSVQAIPNALSVLPLAISALISMRRIRGQVSAPTTSLQFQIHVTISVLHSMQILTRLPEKHLTVSAHHSVMPTQVTLTAQPQEPFRLLPQDHSSSAEKTLMQQEMIFRKLS